MSGTDRRSAISVGFRHVKTRRRRSRPLCEALEQRALLSGGVVPQEQMLTSDPAWIGEWDSANGDSSADGGASVDILMTGHPFQVPSLIFTFNKSFIPQLGDSGGTGSPTFFSSVFTPMAHNAQYGFDGELLGTVVAEPMAGSATLGPVVGSYDLKLTNPGSPDAVPNEFTGTLVIGNVTEQLDMTYTSDGFNGIDNPFMLPRSVPPSYSIAPMAENYTVSTTVGRPLTINVAQGATDPQGTVLTVQSVSAISGGTPNASLAGGLLETDPSGDVVYTPPNVSTVTQDSYVYTVVNELGKTAVGTVTITVMPASDGGSSGNQGSSGGQDSSGGTTTNPTQNPGSGSPDEGPPVALNSDDEVTAKAVAILTARIADYAAAFERYETGLPLSVARAATDLNRIKKLGIQANQVFKAAEKLLAKADEADPAIAYAHNLLIEAHAKALANQSSAATAIQEYEKLLEEHPTHDVGL
jgi:hypothetical protein